MVKIMNELFEKLNIKPNDIKLYNTAFLHSSYANEHRAKADYERLEFLGDSIVDLVVSDYLYRSNKYTEGENVYLEKGTFIHGIFPLKRTTSFFTILKNLFNCHLISIYFIHNTS